MEELSKQKCEACRVGAPKVSEEEFVELIKQIPNWNSLKENSELRLKRAFNFNDYAIALDFANKIAFMADAEDHHPAILLEWGKVEVTWWTHKIGGLHKNDFISAAKTDLIYKSLA